MHPIKNAALSIVILLAVMAVGVFGFIFFEHLSFIEALYVTIVTMTTTGYGDIVPTSPHGQAFVVFLLISGVMAIAFVSTNIVGIVIEGQLQSFWGRRNMENEIKKLHNHIIVCGAGRVGEHVIHRLRLENQSCVAIEQDEDICDHLKTRGILYICDNATKDDVLVQAGIEHASGLISALPSDADNVYVTLTAKSLNPGLRIVARMERSESENKLRRAGADQVISPTILGGFRMATAMLKPASVDFVETVLNRTNLQIVLEELLVKDGSPLVGLPISRSLLRATAGINIVGIVRDSDLILNPAASEIIRAGDLLIVLGKREHFSKIEELIASK